MRKYQNLLDCVGTGVIMFGLWAMIKSAMTLILSMDQIKLLVETMGVPEEDFASTIPMMVIGVAVVFGTDMVLRLIIGLSARKEARSRDLKNRLGYMVFAVILCIISVGSLFADTLQLRLGPSPEIMMDAIIAIIIDATSIVMTVELIVAGLKVKRYKKMIAASKSQP